MKYYCIGIKGTGMSTLAQILYDLGNEVSGYDDTVEYKFTQKGLEERDIKIYYDSNHDIDKNTIVTYSVAFKPDHKELKRVNELGLKIKKYNEIVGEITEMFNTISVAGTHGKTSTSSMIRHILEGSIGCNYFIGAGDGYVNKNNSIFVIESDEFNKHFLTYKPTNSIITNMEEEHMECYKDLNDIIDTFSEFANHTKEEIILCGDNKNCRQIKTDKKLCFYGFNDDNYVVVKNVNTTNLGEEFDVYINKEKYDTFLIPVFGEHMILNATAAILMCKKYGVSKDVIKERLKTFHNAKRRFAEEKIGNTIIIDDYAHHPTEIRETLKAVRRKYPNKRIVVVFKPNTYSRTRDFKDQFVEALSIADKVYLTEIDSNRERQEEYPSVTSHLIIDNIDNGELISEDTINKLEDEKDSIICFMSCASVSHLIDSLKKILNN
ncbi:MAG: UDP-N-acetylmuramate--L-alanine ligase [Bacilli bacterium]|nr:UDP-N-acetylmuramate--L-alanine ligase [Bacilli bacterium]